MLKGSFAISRSHGGTQAQEAARRFSAWLSAAAQVSLQLELEADYDSLFAALRAGRVTLAWLPPLLYARAAIEGMRLVAVPERGGAVAFHSAILVAREARWTEAGALQDVRAAWVDRSSASGYAFPRQHLVGSGASFAAESFHGSANSCAAEVAAGRADVCACPVGTGSIDDALSHAEKMLGPVARSLRVLAVTGLISPDGLAITKTAPEDLARALAQAVLRASNDPAGRAAVRDLFRADRLMTPSESTRRMLAAV